MKLTTKELILTAFFAALTAIGAFIKIPMFPVPMTLQLFSAVLSGLVLGSKLGLMSQLVYIIIGLAGLPVFSDGGGLGYIFHYSFGYLLGFCLTAYMAGRLIERTKKVSRPYGYFFTTAVLSAAACYLIGVPYLYIILNYVMNAPADVSTILITGLLVFLPGDIIKAALAAGIAVRIKNLAR